MYITQVEINTSNRQIMKDLSHIGSIHKWVEESFSYEIRKNIRSRKLWRIDSLRNKQYLLIVSPEQPQLNSLERYGVEGTAQTKIYTHFLNTIENGLRARFRVTLNPVVAVKIEKGERGKLKPHVTVGQQKQFLLDRSNKNGFLLREDEFDIVERTYIPFKKEGQRAINLSKVTYEGILTIVDANLFKETLTRGLGKKKAYGFGLMTIIPIRQDG